MAQAKSVVSESMQGIERSVGLAKTALGALGVGMSVSYFVDMIKGSIDAMDHLNDLSKTTKITVENLSGLKLAAKQSGGDLDSIAGSINKLSQNMGKEGDKFKKLGITAKEPVEAFKQLADIFSAIEDPQTRAALGAAALGKSWQGAAPLLSEGSKKIGEMIERGKQLSGVTTEMAEKADALNDQLAELSAVSERSKIAFASGLVGPLTEATKAITLAYEESGKLSALWTAMGALGTFLFTDDMLTQAAKYQKQIRELTAEIEGAKAEADEFETKIWSLFGAGPEERIAAATEKLRLLRIEIKAGDDARAAQRAKEKADSDASAAARKKETDAATARAKAFLDGGKGTIAYNNELASLNTTLAQLSGQGELEAYAEKLQTDAFKDLTDKQKIDLLVTKELILERKNLIETTKEEIKAAIDMVKAQDQITDGTEDYLQTLRDAEDQQKFEISLIGKTSDEVAKLTEMRRREMELLKAVKALGPNASSADVQKLIDANNAAKEGVGILMDQSAALKVQVSIVDTLANSFANLIVAFTGGWKKGIDYARQQLKQFFAELLAYLAKRWILNIVAGGSATFGSTAASAASSTLTSMGTSMMGTGLSALGTSLFGSAATVAGTGTTVGAGTGMMLGTATGEGAIVAGTSGAIGAGGVTASITSALAAIPVWGWIAIAALAAYAYFGGKGGGPKSGGQFQGIFDASGAQTGSVTGQNAFGLKDSELVANEPVSKIALATAKTYFELNKRYGGTTGGMTFGLGFDTDPRGTAQNRIMGYVKDALGNTIFKEHDREIGRDDKTIGPELQLTASRALLAALQASNLQADMAKLLGGVVAATADQATLDALFASANDLANALDMLATNTLPGLTLDGLKALQIQGESLTQTMQRVASAFIGASNDIMASADRISGGKLGKVIRANEEQAAASAWNKLWGGSESASDTIANIKKYSGNLDVLQSMIAAAYEKGGQPAVDALKRLFQAVDANTDATVENTDKVVEATNFAITYQNAVDAANGMPNTNAARASIGDYLQKSLLGANTPLTPMQQLEEAKRQYEANLAKAKLNDMGALQNYGATRDAYLAIARQVYASSGAYNDIFNSTFMQGNGLAGTNFTPYGLQDAVAQTDRIVAALNQNAAIFDQLIQRLNEPLTVQDLTVAKQMEQQNILTATNASGALTSGPVAIP